MPEEFFSDRQYLLADSGYAANNYTLPSFKRVGGRGARNNALAASHINFNDCVKKVQVEVEHTIGYWKARFQSIKLMSTQIKSSDKHILQASKWIHVCGM